MFAPACLQSARESRVARRSGGREGILSGASQGGAPQPKPVVPGGGAPGATVARGASSSNLHLPSGRQVSNPCVLPDGRLASRTRNQCPSPPASAKGEKSTVSR